MYSVILAALITTGTEQTQSWHHCHGCHSCYSSCSCGGCWGGCYGYAYGGYGCSCYGWGGCSCYGCSCYGGYASCGCSCYGPGLWTAGYSNWGTGCYGSWCSGYAGTGWSYYNGPTYAGGVCAGGVCAGGVCAGYVGGVASVATAPSVYASYASPAPSAYASVSTPTPLVARAPAAQTLSGRAGFANEYETVASRIAPAGSPARVIVNLPADSKLWVEQVACPLKGETRAFNTAALQPGSRYFYNLTIESAQGSRQARRIELSPGRTTEVDFRTVASVRR